MGAAPTCGAIRAGGDANELQHIMRQSCKVAAVDMWGCRLKGLQALAAVTCSLPHGLADCDRATPIQFRGCAGTGAGRPSHTSRFPAHLRLCSLLALTSTCMCVCTLLLRPASVNRIKWACAWCTCWGTQRRCSRTVRLLSPSACRSCVSRSVAHMKSGEIVVHGHAMAWHVCVLAPALLQ